jgi:hypothetical protein
MNFEAGGLSRVISLARGPVPVPVNPEELDGPPSQFQSTVSAKDDVSRFHKLWAAGRAVASERPTDQPSPALARCAAALVHQIGEGADSCPLATTRPHPIAAAEPQLKTHSAGRTRSRRSTVSSRPGDAAVHRGRGQAGTRPRSRRLIRSACVANVPSATHSGKS